jgi:pilus assembly protein Flp/PilA
VIHRLCQQLRRRFLADNRGATAIEYGLIAGLIGVVIIGALANDGLKLRATFTTIGNALN